GEGKEDSLPATLLLPLRHRSGPQEPPRLLCGPARLRLRHLQNGGRVRVPGIAKRKVRGRNSQGNYRREMEDRRSFDLQRRRGREVSYRPVRCCRQRPANYFTTAGK